MNPNDWLTSHPLATALVLHLVLWALLLAVLGSVLLRLDRLPKLLRWLAGFPLLFAAAPAAIGFGNALADDLGLAALPGWPIGPEPALPMLIGLAALLELPWLLWGLAWATRTPAPPTGQSPWPAAQLRQALVKAAVAEARVVVDAEGRVVLDLQTTGIGDTPRVHRLRLELDETRLRVRVVEQLSPQPDPRPTTPWRTITVIGLLDLAGLRARVGSPAAAGSREARGLLVEMNPQRARLQAQVARAGWDWQPVLIDLPPPLRRLSA